MISVLIVFGLLSSPGRWTQEKGPSYVLVMHGKVQGVFEDASGLPERGKAVRTARVSLKKGRVAAAFVRRLPSARGVVAPPLSVEVRHLDAAGTVLARWIVRSARPIKWTGPTLNASGGGDVAMDELELACEGIDPADIDP
jgi:hypothetical protein